MSRRIKVIGFEEHYKSADIELANKDHPIQQTYNDWQKFGRYVGKADEGIPPGIYDLGAGRIAAMDKAGIDVQILSHTAPGPEEIEPKLAASLARSANDAVYRATAAYPDRLLGFATLPMRDPIAAARELERCVQKLGFVGALVNGNCKGRYFDDQFFWPVFEAAEALQVPIYMHPNRSPQSVVDALYQGFNPIVSGFLAQAGVGWHYDTAIHCLRMILGGVFDKFPSLQIIVGHHFEMLSWVAWRTAAQIPKKDSGLQHEIVHYLKNNFYGGMLAGEADQEPGKVDPNWELAYNAYKSMVGIIGPDRVLFTTDYPYGRLDAARQYFDTMPLSEEDKNKLGHGNAERLLKLSS